MGPLFVHLLQVQRSPAVGPVSLLDNRTRVTSSPVTPNTTIMSAVKVGLSNKRNIDRMDQGLVSVNGLLHSFTVTLPFLTQGPGAQQVIQLIKSRPTATISKLILGHNELSDEGCITLFQFLDSVHGHNFPTSEISLNANQIGDRGLLAIASYLENNSTLRELFLQNVREKSLSSGFC